MPTQDSGNCIQGPSTPTKYSLSVWDPHTAKTQTWLRWSKGELSARWVLNRFDGKDSVTEMLSTLKWKTLKSRRIIARLSMPYKMRHRLASHKNANLQSAGHSYSTRSTQYSYRQPTAIRDYYKYAFYPRTITEWNKLPTGYSIVQFAGCF